MPYLRVSTSRLLQTLEDSAINAQCWELFWDLYMPHGDCIPEDITLNWGHPMTWIEVANELPGDDVSLKRAFSALIVSRISLGSRDDCLVHKGLYGQALNDLQLALRDPKRVYSDETLIASMLLGVYEILEGSAMDSDWLSHAQGAARLIELRGPELHKTRQAHHSFLACRIPTVYAAIVQRQATYLAKEQWRTVPWESQHRAYFDRLIDIATELPGLLEAIDMFKRGSPNTPQGLAIIGKLARLQKSLDTWKRYLKKEGAAQNVKHLPGRHESYPFETELWYDNHVFANANSLYHTYSLVVAEAAEDLLGDLEIRKNCCGLVDGVFDSRNHATCIAQMIPYCLQPDMGALGACIITFPTKQALSYFQRTGHTRVVSWLDKILAETRERDLNCAQMIIEPYFMRNGIDRSGLSPTNKSESSDDGSERSSQYKSQDRRASAVMIRFVYENPSRFYKDLSVEERLIDKIPIRSKSEC